MCSLGSGTPGEVTEQPGPDADIGLAPRPGRGYRARPVGPDAATVLGVRARRQLPEPPSRQRVAGIRRRLRRVYGIPAMAPHGHPIAELVLTVLSQSTNDRNRDVAYLRLRERLPSWEQRRDAPAGGGRARRSGRGASRRSSPVACRRSCGRSPPTLATLLTSSRWTGWPRHPLRESRDYLVALPGVGRKTAACVLLFALGKREVPVDTHVSRVGARLGLLPAGAPFEVLHDRMLALTPPRRRARAARQPAAPRTPHLPRPPPPCERCALEPICPSSLLRQP